MKQLSISKFAGLQIQPNSFTNKDGALEIANNVIMSQDFLITKRRGFRQYHKMPTGTVLNALANFGTSIFAFSNNSLFRILTSTVSAQVVSNLTSGTEDEITVNYFAHGITTGDYIADLNVIDSSSFNAAFPNRQADFFGINETTSIGAGSFKITADNNATAIVSSGLTDASFRYYKRADNGTLDISTARTLIASKNLYFTTNTGIRKLERETDSSKITGQDPGLDCNAYYYSLGVGVGALQENSQVGYRVLFGRRDVNENLYLGAPGEALTLVNNKIKATSVSQALLVLTITSNNHGLSNSSFIYAYDVTTSGTLANGTPFAVSNVATNTFDITLTVAMGAVTNISFSYAKSVNLIITIPEQITATSGHFVRIYRTEKSLDSTIVPIPQYFLVEEVAITSISSNNTLNYSDNLPDEIIKGQAELYTNYTSEGALQANNEPPIAKDIALFRGYTFYANCQQKRQLEIDLLAPDQIANTNTITIAGIVYKFVWVSGNLHVANSLVTSLVTVAAPVATVTQTAHGFTDQDYIYIYESTLTSPETLVEKQITVTGLNTFTYTTTATGSAKTITYEGTKDSSGKRLVKLTHTDTTTATLSQAIDFTARALIKAVNRATDILSPKVYAINFSADADVPGKILLQSRYLGDSTFTAIMNANGGAFSPNLSTAQSDTLLDRPGDLYISKYNEPESVPYANNISVDTTGEQIVRIAALRDSLIIMKSNGVYRLNGFNPGNFIITALDTTVKLTAANTVAVLNNSVYALTNQGVVQITDSGVRIVSRPIEPFLNAVIGNAYTASVSSAIAYENERSYYLSTLKPNSTSSFANVTYVYNYLTDNWVSGNGTSFLFKAGMLSSLDNHMYFISSEYSNFIYRERNENNNIDFSDQEYCVNTIFAQPSTANSKTGTNIVTVTTVNEHGLSIGNNITISRTTSGVYSSFSGSTLDIEGIRVVASIINNNSFTFEALSNSTSDGNGVAYYQKGISEVNCVTKVTNGSALVDVTTLLPHKLQTGNSIRINSISASINAVLASANIAGYRTITKTSDTSFIFTAIASASGNVTGTSNFSDKTQNGMFVTVRTSEVTPTIGDAIIVGNKSYVIKALNIYSGTETICELFSNYNYSSYTQTFLHAGIKSTIKFSPITDDNIGTLKQFPEFQATFRNGAACSVININFSTDRKNSVEQSAWNFAVSSSKESIFFGGWGRANWGTSPWGGGNSVFREYYTKPAVTLRIYVPRDSFIGTFIQPILYHSVACESIDLQSISLLVKDTSNRTSR